MALNRFKNFIDKVHDQLEDEKRVTFKSGSLDDDDEKFEQISALDAKPSSKSDDKKVNLLKETFGHDDCEMWITLFLKYPSLQNISGLHIKLEHADDEWMTRFLDYKGLETLFAVLETFTYSRYEKGISHIEDAVSFVKCVNCVKAVMSATIGLDYFVENPDISKNIILGEWMRTKLILI